MVYDQPSPAKPVVKPAPTASGGTRYEDNYGRRLRNDIRQADNKMFHSILPDNPFGVIRDTAIGATDADCNYMPVLQFWTWLAELHLCMRGPLSPPPDTSSSGETLVASGNSPDIATERARAASISADAGGLCRCDVVDGDGDWCGSRVVDEAWIRPRDKQLFPFIAISEAKGFTHDECPDWTYYIPKERTESEWDVYYVLLLERNPERGLWERVGLGKVFKVAFREDTWREIKLG